MAAMIYAIDPVTSVKQNEHELCRLDCSVLCSFFDLQQPAASPTWDSMLLDRDWRDWRELMPMCERTRTTRSFATMR